MGNFLAITILIIALVLIAGAFYYTFVYLKIKPSLMKIDELSARGAELAKDAEISLMQKHKENKVRNRAPSVPYAEMIAIVDGIMKVEFEFKREQYVLNDYFIQEDIADMIKELTSTIYTDIGVSLIHDLEYYMGTDFIIKYISRACREFIYELTRESRQ